MGSELKVENDLGNGGRMREEEEEEEVRISRLRGEGEGETAGEERLSPRGGDGT